ncbi:hypothetical protein [Candidatus Amarolinea dominans]|uniref:hypothetical protein n=1 Tax=Candidatus Amarolinea dominans TaxID=3140696 RepID=UPI001D1F2114|nr:hypothetical protein [Anaerolineae bacterium]
MTTRTSLENAKASRIITWPPFGDGQERDPKFHEGQDSQGNVNSHIVGLGMGLMGHGR